MKNDGRCRQYWGLLNEYADGRLEGRKRENAEMHLASCASCRDALGEIRRLRGLAAQAPVPEPSDGFWERCMRTVAAAPPARRSFAPSLVRPALGLALAAALAMLLIWFPPAWYPSALIERGEIAAQAELPESEYVMQHAGFATAQPLGATSHYVLLSARAAEDEDRHWAGNPQSPGLSEDVDIGSAW
jgi:anti-sigma factor RsiW